MRSNLLKSMASVFAMLAMVAFMAGGAMAQDGPKISGGAAVGFGQLSWDTGAAAGGPGVPVDGDSLNAQIEANVIVSGTNENMDYYFRMRARGTVGDTVVNGGTEGTFGDNQLQTVRVRVGWNINDMMRLEVGKLPGIGGIGFADKAPVRRPSGLRFSVNNAGFYDVGALNFSFKTGGIRAGAAIAAGNCQADCTGGVTPAAGNTIANGNQMTIMPYFQGSFGPAKVGLRHAIASGDVVGDDGGATYDGSVDSSMSVFEAAFNFGQGEAALEYTTATEGCIDPIGLAGCNDAEATSIDIAVTGFGGLIFQYGMDEEDDGDATTTNAKATRLALAYLFDVGGGSVGPEIVTADYDPSEGVAAVIPADEPSARLIRLVMTTGF